MGSTRFKTPLSLKLSLSLSVGRLFQNPRSPQPRGRSTIRIAIGWLIANTSCHWQAPPTMSTVTITSASAGARAGQSLRRTVGRPQRPSRAGGSTSSRRARNTRPRAGDKSPLDQAKGIFDGFFKEKEDPLPVGSTVSPFSLPSSNGGTTAVGPASPIPTHGRSHRRRKSARPRSTLLVLVPPAVLTESLCLPPLPCPIARRFPPREASARACSSIRSRIRPVR